LFTKNPALAQWIHFRRKVSAKRPEMNRQRNTVAERTLARISAMWR
jgi:hypothetical protein